MTSRVTIADVGMSCARCFYWIPSGNAAVRLGRCFRNPPQDVAGFPLARSEDVCGEWQSDQVPPAHMQLAEVAGDFDNEAGDLDDGVADLTWPVPSHRCHVVVTHPDDPNRRIPCGSLAPCPRHDVLRDREPLKDGTGVDV